MPAPSNANTWDAPGLSWDQPGLTWDGAAPPTPTPPRKAMAQVKLNLDRLTREERINLARQIHTAMTGNANFPTPNPALTALDSATDALETGNGELNLLRQQAKEKTVEVDGLDTAHSQVLRDLAAYVQNTSGGDEGKILSAGMAVRDPAAPVTMTAVTGLESTPGDDSGEIDLSWNPVRGASSYEIQSSPDPITPTSWGHAGISTKSSLTLTGQPSGARCWWRVRAVGASGPGPWSDPATKIVP
jgi:hypothetical protein